MAHIYYYKRSSSSSSAALRKTNLVQATTTLSRLRDMELKIMGIPNAEEVLDAVKDYVENGEVWV